MTMFTKKTLLVSVSMLLCSQLLASEVNNVMDEDEDATRRAKCGKFSSLIVCNSVTANSFVTPSGPLFNGLRNYAVLSNQATIPSGDNALWAATPAGNISAGISVNNLTGAITLPESGIFLVQYSVRFTYDPNDTVISVASAHLQQTVAGAPTNITQPAITSTTATEVVATEGTDSEVEVTGYALITTTSALNNVINLVVTYTNNFSLLTATLIDANAQMTILQLN